MTRKTKLIVLFLLILGVAGGVNLASVVFNSNSVAVEHGVFLVEPGESASTVIDHLEEQLRLEDAGSLRWYVWLRGWEAAFRPGRYEIEGGLNNRTLARRLMSGSRETVTVQFRGVRLPEDLAGVVSGQIQADSAKLTSALNHENLRHFFIPNSYEFYWDTSAKGFVKRMQSEWEKWWTADRRRLAQDLNLTPQEVHVLASIVKAETSKKDEAPTVAGLYLNRLRKDMHLQADPTLIYAAGDFSIRRVLDKHRAIDSPYNTYMHTGLPPAPINYPEPVYLEAVLNAETHSYIFMCAREDFSGYHNFAKTYRAHQRNAKRYQRQLNKQRVFR